MVGIYKITNPKGKIYVGQSVNIEERWKQYHYCSKSSLGRKIYNSIKKYGWEAHIKEKIEECSIDELDKREVYWGEHYQTLTKFHLNLSLGAGNCKKHSQETRDRMSASQKLLMTPSHRKKLSEVKMGVKKSEAHKLTMRVPKKSNKNYLNNVGKWVSQTEVKVGKYTLQNEFIQQYNSLKEAELNNHPNNKKGNNICNCLAGKQKTAYGFKWSRI